MKDKAPDMLVLKLLLAVSVHLLLFSSVNGKIIINHETGLLRKNCSALLHVPLYQNGSERATECPLWFKRDNETNVCTAGPTLDGIISQDMSTLQTSIMQCHCMTEEDGAFTVGACLYDCYTQSLYYQLPCRVSELQNYTCPPWMKRGGPLCSKCIQGYGLPVYSYKLEYVECDDNENNWLKYLAVAYGPLALFYILVAMFSISFTSPTVIGLVMVCQLTATPSALELLDGLAGENSKILGMYATFALFFNLDFGRIYYNFCLNPSATAIQIQVMDYGIVVFPVVLILLTYFLVQLHDKNLRPVVWIWKTFLKPLRRRLRISTSLIDVFASFLYLSSSRLLLTSLYILMPVKVYHQGPDGLITKQGVFIEPTLEYFGKLHIKYALLGILMILLFYLLPVLLLFAYPFHCFQRILNKARLNSLVLKTFIDIFQGYYKDGTNGTRDYRIFSVLPFTFPILEYLSFVLTECILFYYFAAFFILLYVAMLLIFQPFKLFKHNIILTSMLVTVLLLCWSMIIYSTDAADKNYLYFSVIIIILSLCFLPLYVAIIVCFWFKSKCFSVCP